MRLVFVNHAHPATPHVSGMRLGHFAHVMAQRGHAVILLTASLSDEQVAPSLHAALEDLAAHEKGTPLFFSVQPRPYWPIKAVRQGRVPAVIRRGLTAWSFLRHGGAFPDWTLAAKSTAMYIAQTFEPDVVWATFGNTSNLWLAQFIARHASCPWVMDVKDNWEAFVPPGLRRLMARRFSDAGGMTCNALHHQMVANRWMSARQASVIYSGVGEAFFSAKYHEAASSSRREIILVGSTYDKDRLAHFLRDLSDWLAGLKQHELGEIAFVYAGSDHACVSGMLKSSPLPCRMEVNEQLTLPQLANRCARALVNCYLWAPFTFHHKLLELLVAGAPVIAYPGEHEESRAFARATQTPFFVCPDVRVLKDALSRAWQLRDMPADSGSAPPWRWDDFARDLETFFEQVMRKHLITKKFVSE